MITQTRINQRLQAMFTENYTQEQFVGEFIYLTNKSRGEYCTERLLIKKYQYGGIGALIKRLDPIRYNLMRSEL